MRQTLSLLFIVASIVGASDASAQHLELESLPDLHRQSELLAARDTPSAFTLHASTGLEGWYLTERSGGFDLHGALDFHAWDSQRTFAVLSTTLAVPFWFNTPYEVSHEALVMPLSGQHDIDAVYGLGDGFGIDLGLNLSVTHEGRGPDLLMRPIAIAPVPYHREQLELSLHMRDVDPDGFAWDYVAAAYTLDNVGYTDPFATETQAFTQGAWFRLLGMDFGPDFRSSLLHFGYRYTEFTDGFLGGMSQFDIRLLNMDIVGQGPELALSLKLDMGTTFLEDTQFQRGSMLFVGHAAFGMRLDWIAYGIACSHDAVRTPEGERFVAELRGELYLDLFSEDLGLWGSVRVAWEHLTDANFAEDSEADGGYAPSAEGLEPLDQFAIEVELSYQVLESARVGVYGLFQRAHEPKKNHWDPWASNMSWSTRVGAYFEYNFNSLY